ncbi:MAG TPA: L-fucokinase [Oscillospiraceae bacterium]|nr:L-fucokinase [Oscillospiraceae bacterium]HPK36383.1 L-fucokinase [Oscillospiraceae bacterium]HPR75759.1 L-fucokinase [Oscillospiraceae bacterium]
MEKDFWRAIASRQRADYLRLLTDSTRPFFDIVAVTASNKRQAEAYRVEIENRKAAGLLPNARYEVVADPDGKRVGSGGATLNLLSELGDTGGQKILIIHSGGDSRRIPQYSARGKLFSPIPRPMADGSAECLFDELMITAAGIAGRVPAGALVMSGDVLVLFDPSQITQPRLQKNDCAITARAPVEVGADHGVFLSRSFEVAEFLHKLSPKELRKRGAVSADGSVELDTGMIFLSEHTLEILHRLAFDHPDLIDDTVRLNFYGDLLYPMAADSTFEKFLLQSGELPRSKKRDAARTLLWNTLHARRLRHLPLSPAQFIHFGTNRELLNLMIDGTAEFADLGWHTAVHSEAYGEFTAINSVVRHSDVGKCFIENSRILHCRIGDGCIISNCDLEGVTIPENTVLSGYFQTDGTICVRCCGLDDNPKENAHFGRKLDRSLWNAPIFTSRSDMKPAVQDALDIIAGNVPADAHLGFDTSFENCDLKAMADWRSSIAAEVQNQKLAFAAVRDLVISSEMPAHPLPDPRSIKKNCRVCLPLRVNWGGWTDTPPYCYENGGCVLNMAVTIDGKLPVTVVLRRHEKRCVTLKCADSGEKADFYELESIQDCGDPLDPFALHKAALLCCRVFPISGGELHVLLERFGGGFSLSTKVEGIPRGSGLGTSSILAAACVKGIYQFFGIEVDDATIFSRVLCIEQLMSTGGGWQDQVGGLTPGIKLITSKPGAPQVLEVEPVALTEEKSAEFSERFVLIYTGERRLARFLLREIMSKYLDREPEALKALKHADKLCASMRDALLHGDVDGFAVLMNAAWESRLKLDKNTTDTRIEEIFETCAPYIDGKFICGAGGGGFLEVMLKKGVSKAELAQALNRKFGGEVWLSGCECYTGAPAVRTVRTLRRIKKGED